MNMAFLRAVQKTDYISTSVVSDKKAKDAAIRYPEKLKIEVAESVVNGGLTLRAAAKKFDVSHNSVTRYKSLYLEGKLHA